MAPAAPFFINMTTGVPAATVISSGAACRYGADGKCSHDTLSREISHRNAARTIRGGDFSTPLRFGRNDGRGRAGFFVICARRALPPPSEPFEPSEPCEPSHRRCVQWHSRIGGGERSEPITRMRIMPYDTESQSRNADFISIGRRAIHNPRGRRPRQT